MVSQVNVKEETVCVVSLGYVGLPLAEIFSKELKVMGSDADVYMDSRNIYLTLQCYSI